MQAIKAFAHTVVAGAGQVLFPPVCQGCRRLVSEPGTLCGACWSQLRFIEAPICPVYGTPFTHDMGEGIVSAEAIANPPPFEHARAAVIYDGIAGRMVRGLKYNDRTDLARWMSGWMARAGADIIPETDVIVAVPLHRGRFFQRRFNQSAELARALARRTGLDFEADVMRRVRATKQQVGLSQDQRQANMRGAFGVPAECEILVHGRRVLLIDDVYTTGATVFAATKALKRAGAASVNVLAFARVVPGTSR